MDRYDDIAEHTAGALNWRDVKRQPKSAGTESASREVALRAGRKSEKPIGEQTKALR